MLAPRSSLPSVESSLDAFIAKAHDHAAEPVPAVESPEQALRKQIEDLNGRLAEVEAQARARVRRWPWMLGAFLVGAASMLAVSFLFPMNTRVETVSSAPPPQAAPVTVTAPAEPTPAPQPAPPPPPAGTQPTTEPAPAPPTPTTAVNTTTKPKPKHRAKASSDSQAESQPTEKPAGEQPKSDESGSGLYNPF